MRPKVHIHGSETVISHLGTSQMTPFGHPSITGGPLANTPDDHDHHMGDTYVPYKGYIATYMVYVVIGADRCG